MALSPQRIRDTNFKSAKRGYDQGEVNAFVEEVATALETAQNEATAMEARARAAVARLQELSQQRRRGGRGRRRTAEIQASVDEAETISRTLLLAQRTADTTVAEAQAEADRVLAAARDEAAAHLDGARQEAAALVEEAKADARRAGESERVQVEGEVQALLARRDFLESDVDHLEQYLVAQRERITEAVASLTDLVQRVPGRARRHAPPAAVGRRRAGTTTEPAGDARRRRSSTRTTRTRSTSRTPRPRSVRRSPRSPRSPRPASRSGRRHADVDVERRCSTRTASRPQQLGVVNPTDR